MDRTPEMLVPQRYNFDHPMIWQRAERVGNEQINVFKCEPCDRFTAQTAK